jgi:hypothetical protein
MASNRGTWQSYFISPRLQVAGETRSGSTLSLAQALDRHQRILLLGAPGAGKTTILRHLEANGARYSIGTPSYLSLAQISSPPELVVQLQGLLSLGASALLLDDLDAVVGEYRSDFCRVIAESARRNPGLRIVLASRSMANDALEVLRAFIRLETLPLNQQQIAEFTQRHSQRPDALLQRIRESVRLSTLATNPMLLGQLIKFEDVVVSDSLVLDPLSLLREWVREEAGRAGQRLKVRAAEIDRVLRSLAARLMFEDRNELDLTDLSDVMRCQQPLINPSSSQLQAIVEALSASGLIHQRNSHFRFVHRTILEFYFTEHLRARHQDPRLNILLNRRSDALLGLRFRRAEENSIAQFLRLQDTSPPIPCEAAFPFYAARGSLELFMAFVAVSAAGFALKKFAEGFFSALGSAAAGAIQKSDRQKTDALPEFLIELAPGWARSNPSVLQSFANGLAEELGRRKATELTDMDLALAYLQAHYTVEMGDSVVVVASKDVMKELEG